MSDPLKVAAREFINELYAREAANDLDEANGWIVACHDPETLTTYYGLYDAIEAMDEAQKLADSLNEANDDDRITCTVHPVFKVERDG